MSESAQLIQSFVAITNCPLYLAEQFLSRNDNDLTAAIEDYYNTYGEDEDPSNTIEYEQNIGSAFNSASASASSAAAPAASSNSRVHPSGAVRTLRDLLGDSDDEEKTNQNFFTGGEKSALQVENPDQNDRNKPAGGLVDRIIQRAKNQLGEPDDRPSAKGASAEADNFTGTGFRLGDATHSLEAVQGTTSAPKPAKVTRQITFWREGFTVGDGPFRRYDDRENYQLLSELKQGRVPVSLLDVELGQDVDVTVIRKVDEDYVPPKANQGGFHGQGQRLGSPVPGEVPVSSIVVDEPKSNDKSAAAASKTADDSRGDSPVQIRFANGKRLSHRFNASDPISLVYDFVRNHPYNESSGRAFILSHAFPVKPIEASDGETVESTNLKSAVIIQRWK